MKQPVIQFEQRIKSNRPETAYVYPVSHDTEVIKERQKYLGSLMVRKQATGFRMGADMMDYIAHSGNLEDLESVAGLVGVTALNTGSINLASDRVKRRNVKMLLLADPETETRLTNEQVLATSKNNFVGGIQLADAVVLDRMHGRVVKGREVKLGRTMISLATKLAALQSGATRVGGDAYKVQMYLRDACHDMQHMAERMWEKQGVDPTFAQLADPYSPFAVSLRTGQSHGVFESYAYALDNHQQAVAS